MSAEIFKPETKEILKPEIPIIISGTGEMSRLVADATKDYSNYVLLPIVLSSNNPESKSKTEFTKRINLDNLDFQFIPTNQSEITLRKIKETNPNLIIVDFTVPNAVNPNAELFTKLGIQFIMGTTGGNRQDLMNSVKNSEISAVIDVNMSTLVNTMRLGLEHMAKIFPGIWKGYKLKIKESHQIGKQDVSGTAMAWLEIFKTLGVELDGEIEIIRNTHVPHGHHWYTVTNPDGTAVLEICTFIEGRTDYIPVVMRSIDFLHQKIKKGNKGKIYTSLDVLKN